MEYNQNILKNILFDYLRNNLSTRKICRKYPEINDSTGFKSHNILKKFELKKEDKGRLFLYTKKEALKIIDIVIRNKGGVIDTIVEPENFKKYKDIYVTAKGEGGLYNVLNGELRNLVQSFFMERKKQYGICQHGNCKNNNLDVAHHHRRSRKDLFRIAVSKNKIENDGYYKFDIYKIIIDFLNLHKDNAVIFLCKEHHNAYDHSADKARFLKNIEK